MNKQVQGLTKIETVRGLLEKMKPEIQKVLPKHLDPARIIRMALTDFQTVKHLNECTPESFLGALMECSQLGLEPGKILGHAYLLPFRNKTGQYICRCIIGYQGLSVLARRSGEIRTLEPRLVRENDFFEYEFGLHADCRHKPAKSDRGEITHAYAVATLATGERQFDVMDIEEIEAIHARSQSAESGPWISDYGQMCKKTVLKRLCRVLPMSVDLKIAIAMDTIPEVQEASPLEEDNFGVIPSPQEIRLVKPNQQMPINKDAYVPSPYDEEKQDEEQEGIDQDNHIRSSVGETSTKTPISNAQGNSSVHPEVSKDKKDPRKKEIAQLKMDIQNVLFDRSPNPEDMNNLLKAACLRTKCSMGHQFLVVKDLAQTDNLAWLREIADELGRM